MHLVVPAGWQFTPAGGAGAFLSSPQQPEASPIEIVGWDVPRGGDRSPAAAASAQETLLVRTGPYARTYSNDYRTAAGATVKKPLARVRGQVLACIRKRLGQ